MKMVLKARDRAQLEDWIQSLMVVWTGVGALPDHAGLWRLDWFETRNGDSVVLHFDQLPCVAHSSMWAGMDCGLFGRVSFRFLFPSWRSPDDPSCGAVGGGVSPAY